MTRRTAIVMVAVSVAALFGGMAHAVAATNTSASSTTTSAPALPATTVTSSAAPQQSSCVVLANATSCETCELLGEMQLLLSSEHTPGSDGSASGGQSYWCGATTRCVWVSGAAAPSSVSLPECAKCEDGSDPLTTYQACSVLSKTSCGACIFAGGAFSIDDSKCFFTKASCVAAGKKGRTCATDEQQCGPCDRYHNALSCSNMLPAVIVSPVALAIFIVAVSFVSYRGLRNVRREQEAHTEIENDIKEHERTAAATAANPNGSIAAGGGGNNSMAGNATMRPSTTQPQGRRAASTIVPVNGGGSSSAPTTRSRSDVGATMGTPEATSSSSPLMAGSTPPASGEAGRSLERPTPMSAGPSPRVAPGTTRE